MVRSKKKKKKQNKTVETKHILIGLSSHFISLKNCPHIQDHSELSARSSLNLGPFHSDTPDALNSQLGFPV